MRTSVRRSSVSRSAAIIAVLLGLSAPAFAGQSSRSTSTAKSVTASRTTAAKPAAVKPAETRTRTTLARARAAARARVAAAAIRVQQEAMTPQWKHDEFGNLVPDVRAAAAIVFDPKTHEVLWEENSHAERSIASLTKVMTAVTFIADEPDLSQRVSVTRADMRNASVTYLKAGEVISFDDLLHLALIASDNAAARVLARTSEGGTEAFVARMNEMAARLGMTNTHYADPTGLDSDNVSSAYDYSQLITFAASDERLGPIMRTAEYEAHTSFGPINIHSTDKLLGTNVDVLGAKTGFITKAGYCLATLLQVPQGSQIAVVVLGAANSTTRFWEARHLFNWVVSRTQGINGGHQ